MSIRTDFQITSSLFFLCFGDAKFMNFPSRFANLVLSDLISLQEREFGESFNKSLIKSFGFFKKNFDWLTLEFDRI